MICWRKVWSEKCCDQHCRWSRTPQLHLHVLRLHPPQLCQRTLPCKEINKQKILEVSLASCSGETEEVWGCPWGTLFREWVWRSEPIISQSTRLWQRLILSLSGLPVSNLSVQKTNESPPSYKKKIIHQIACWQVLNENCVKGKACNGK